MRHRNTIRILIGAALIVVGIILFAGAMSALDWEFSALTTGRYETSEWIVAETFRDVRIVTDVADVRILPAADGVARVELYEEASAKHRVSVEGGVLTIEVDDQRAWYQHIGIGFDSPRLCVYLPQQVMGALTIETSTGDAWLSQVEATEVSVCVSTGDVRLEHGTVTEISVRVSTGDVAVSDTSCEKLLSEGSTGDLSMTDVTVRGRLAIERSTGDVKLTRCDAAAIKIETDTGDVTGTLLTPKTFSANSGTGDVEVPRGTVGGACEITTHTGDIKIRIVS